MFNAERRSPRVSKSIFRVFFQTSSASLQIVRSFRMHGAISTNTCLSKRPFGSDARGSLQVCIPENSFLHNKGFYSTSRVGPLLPHDACKMMYAHGRSSSDDRHRHRLLAGRGEGSRIPIVHLCSTVCHDLIFASSDPSVQILRSFPSFL